MQFSGRVTTPRHFLLAVGAAYLLAWDLPSAIGPFGAWIEGPEATWEALSPIWTSGWWGSWWGRTLSVASALTNVVFVVALIHAWRWSSPARLAGASGDRRPFRWAVWAIGVCAVVNLCWVALWDNRRWLASGYFVWLSAFVALAVVLAWMQRAAGNEAVVRLRPPASAT